MYCVQCGTELPHAAMFCPSCGRRRHQPEDAAASPSPSAPAPKASHARLSNVKAQFKESAPGLAGALIGAAIAQYFGLHLLIPVGAAVVVWAIASRASPGRSRPFLAAIAVQGGHVIWFLVGLFAPGGLPASLWIEVGLMTGSLIWLFVRPGFGPVVLLTLWQAFALLVNVQAFVEAVVGTSAHAALLAHVILRVMAIGLMIIGMRTLRQARAARPSAAV